MQKEQIMGLEKRQEQQQIEYESKIELLKQKILSKYNDKTEGTQDQLSELLNLCRSDLGEILDKVHQKIMKDAVIEE